MNSLANGIAAGKLATLINTNGTVVITTTKVGDKLHKSIKWGCLGPGEEHLGVLSQGTYHEHVGRTSINRKDNTRFRRSRVRPGAPFGRLGR